MAVLSANKQRPHRGKIETESLPLAGYTNFGTGNDTHTVYKGSIMVCDVSDTDGYFRAAPAASTTNAATGDIFGGIALKKQVVGTADAADGTVEVTVAKKGIFGFPVGSLAITDVGALAYADDDATITTTRTNKYLCGLIVDYDSTYIWVDIAPAWMRTQTGVTGA